MLQKAITASLLPDEEKLAVSGSEDEGVFDGYDSDDLDRGEFDDKAYAKLLSQIDTRLLIMTQEDADAAVERARYLPYSPADDTAIEAALANLLNDHVLDIRVRAAAAAAAAHAFTLQVVNTVTAQGEQPGDELEENFLRELDEQWRENNGTFEVGTLTCAQANFRLVQGFLFVEHFFEWVCASLLSRCLHLRARI
jgi:hypothetical protein